MLGLRRLLPPLAALLILAGLGYGGYRLLFAGDATSESAVPTYAATRGPLRVTVLETGSVEALRSQTISSSVEGRSVILYIVPEGTVITPKDVEEKKLLVQLDVADVQDRLNRQKVELAQAQAAYKNAISSLDIQRQQNASEIRKAELDVRFARLDLERYVGKDLSELLLAASVIPEAETESELPAATGTDGGGTDGSVPPTPAVAPQHVIEALLADERLEGEAQQKMRQLESDISLAEEEFRRAQVKLDWTERLLEKGYVSREEQEADRIARQRWQIELDRANTARAQFVTYDFRKEVERLLSDLIEAEAQLARTIKRARSSEARELAEVRSRAEQEQLQAERFEKLEAQVQLAEIRATQPGLVVYASSRRRRRWGGDDPIREGTEVQERQPLIEIPDLSSLGVKVSVHESVVERVREGQSATVLVDAFPDRPLPGTVSDVARLPDPPDSWLNPDLKVYSTEVTLAEVPPRSARA